MRSEQETNRLCGWVLMLHGLEWLEYYLGLENVALSILGVHADRRGRADFMQRGYAGQCIHLLTPRYAGSPDAN